MDRQDVTTEADKAHQPRVTEEEDGEQVNIMTIMSLLDKVAEIVDSVQASQRRIEERHTEIENSIKTIQIDILKLAKDHNTTGSTVNKLLEKTRKVSSNVKDVRARVDKQSARVKKVETTQEELLRKNRFRVVIYQGETEVPCASVSKFPKDCAVSGGQEENLDNETGPPADLSSDEEYMVVEEQETAAARLKKSGLKRIDTIKKAFTKENIQKTRQNIGQKMNRISTRIVPPERREKIRQSGEKTGERLRQSGERLKQSITKAAPSRESFTFTTKKVKERTVAEGQEVIQNTVADQTTGTDAAEPASGEVTYTEVVTEVKQGTSFEINVQHPEDKKEVFYAESTELATEKKGEEAVASALNTKQTS
ncbi:caveolae-associated protein 4 [Latimeria chalumnae]|uniref:Muscle-restricted coiled-coil protein n=1 Tax=Latimeria chalumnae TaxID=7897 RepID=H3ADQ4_LATCH|nr:PREDICTED: muscle-related coiled-coil protein [Latimeria chalumnae]|eukprot:XP_006010362.1 PREDICTED: muscle-related coiled-coil protein [Latimeria chalumnae]